MPDRLDAVARTLLARLESERVGPGPWRQRTWDDGHVTLICFHRTRWIDTLAFTVREQGGALRVQYREPTVRGRTGELAEVVLSGDALDEEPLQTLLGAAVQAASTSMTEAIRYKRLVAGRTYRPPLPVADQPAGTPMRFIEARMARETVILGVPAVLGVACSTGKG